jgi:DNA polymerase-3 subunit gamma/tau
LLARVRELDRDAPDYDRALAELAAFLQRIAFVQIVPDAAHEDEEFDAEALTRLARAIAPEDVQLYYQIALGGRRDLAMAPEPRIGFEMSLLRMLAFRPETAADSVSTTTTVKATAAAAARTGVAPAVSPRAPGMGVAQPPAAAPATAAATDLAPATTPAPGAPGMAAAQPLAAAPGAAREPAVREVTMREPAAREPTMRDTATGPKSIDAGNWTAVIEAANLSGLVRQFAQYCLPASFADDVLRLHFDESAAHQRSRHSEDKLAQALSAYYGRTIRIVIEASESAPDTPARRRALALEDQALRAAAAFEADPAVQGLQQRFGAQIDAASVKPTIQT